jgi:hypothetical protein
MFGFGTAREKEQVLKTKTRFSQRFDKPATTRETMRIWEKKEFSTRLDWTYISYGVTSSKTRLNKHVTIRLEHCERENFTTPTNKQQLKQLSGTALMTTSHQHGR